MRADNYCSWRSNGRLDAKRLIVKNQVGAAVVAAVAVGVEVVVVAVDSNICGTIMFGDGSMVEIEGVQTVLFIYKNGEHISLTDVYLIPMLTTNIVSLGQLDEIGYEIVINDCVMPVRDEQKRLLAKVQCSSN
jgi:hypothetical protein